MEIYPYLQTNQNQLHMSRNRFEGDDSGSPVNKWPPRLNGSNFWISVILAFIILMGLDFLFYGVIATETFSTPDMYDDPLMGTMMIGYAIASVLIPLLYFGVFNNANVMNRILFGILLACITFLPGIFMDHSLFEGHDYGTAFMQFAYVLVQFIILSIVVGHFAKVPKE